MSSASLQPLIDGNALLPSSIPADLTVCHVPFDDLLEESRYEVLLESFVRRDLGVALVGPSGCGKSAMTTYALAQPASDLAAIRVPVAFETAEIVRDPGSFARHLLQRLLVDASAAHALGETRRNELLAQASERVVLPTRATATSVAGGADVWLLRGEVAREVSVTIEGAEIQRSTDDALRAVDQVISVIRTNGFVPVLLVDDTDRWLQVPVGEKQALIEIFFGAIVRMLTERGCAVVVAVHETYLALEEYQRGVRGFLTETIAVPRLPRAEVLNKLLDHRVQLQVEDTSVFDLFGVNALEQLFQHYESIWGLSLRWTLQNAHEALTAAWIDGAEQITQAHIRSAAAA